MRSFKEFQLNEEVKLHLSFDSAKTDALAKHKETGQTHYINNGSKHNRDYYVVRHIDDQKK